MSQEYIENGGQFVIRKAYDKPVKQETVIQGDSLTMQEQYEETKISHIMDKYHRTGLVSHVNKYEGVYADVTGLDFQDAKNKVASAETMFNELPAQERRRFNNDPAEFLDFVANKENVDDMRDGIIGNELPDSASEQDDDAGDKQAKRGSKE